MCCWLLLLLKVLRTSLTACVRGVEGALLGSARIVLPLTERGSKGQSSLWREAGVEMLIWECCGQTRWWGSCSAAPEPGKEYSSESKIKSMRMGVAGSRSSRSESPHWEGGIRQGRPLAYAARLVEPCLWLTPQVGHQFHLQFIVRKWKLVGEWSFFKKRLILYWSIAD